MVSIARKPEHKSGLHELSEERMSQTSRNRRLSYLFHERCALLSVIGSAEG
jgi:hypothetical protein